MKSESMRPSEDDALADGRGDCRPACSEEAARMIGAHAEGFGSASGHSTRERVALVLFALLLIAGLIVLVSYITAGHGLNVAATSIDDIAGDMSGYGVVLFEGTVKPDAAADADEDDGPLEGVAKAIGSLGGGDETGRGRNASASADAEASAVGEAEGALAGGAAAEDGRAGRTAADRADETDETSDGDEADGADGGNKADNAGGSVATAAPGSSSSGMALDEAKEVYAEKNASVIAIDSGNLSRYANGRVIMQGGRTYGIFSLTEEDLASMPRRAITTRVTTTTTEDADGLPIAFSSTTRTRDAYGSVSELFAATDPDDIDADLIDRIESILERFDASKVDTVIALTPDPTPFCAVEGVDVVVSFKEQSRFPIAETVGGTLYFDAPEIGEVGVLMVAPGNVVSSKVMKGD